MHRNSVKTREKGQDGMAGRPGRSGGKNRKSPEDHALDGTKPRRSPDPLAVPEAVSDGDRRRVLAGLPAEGRRIARALLDQFLGWDEPSMMTLRAYAMSSIRLEALQSDPAADSLALHRELRSFLALRVALGLPA